MTELASQTPQQIIMALRGPVAWFHILHSPMAAFVQEKVAAIKMLTSRFEAWMPALPITDSFPDFLNDCWINWLVSKNGDTDR